MFGGTQAYNDTRGANVIVGMENSEKFAGDCLGSSTVMPAIPWSEDPLGIMGGSLVPENTGVNLVSAFSVGSLIAVSQDLRRQVSSAKPIVDVDDSHAGSAAIQHPQQCR